MKVIAMYAAILKSSGFNTSEARDSHGRWEKVGSNLGSNEGGAHIHNGKKYYVKFPPNPEQVHSEVASDKIHELMGCNTIRHTAEHVNGDIGSVTEWKDDLKPLGREGWRNLDDKQKQQAANTFMASALTKNWDVVGMVYDNMCKDKKGDIHIVDTGGSFSFRAQGEHKDFDNDANKEVDNFLNPEKTSGRVFSKLMKSNPEMFTEAAKRLKTITRDDFVKATHGMKDQSSVVDTLMERKKVLMGRFKII